MNIPFDCVTVSKTRLLTSYVCPKVAATCTSPEASAPERTITDGNSQPERHALVVGVRPEKRDVYLTLHRVVWPEVERTLRECNVTNYSIFIFGDVLFAYYEYVGDDHEADMARIGQDPKTREWWTLTDPCQMRIADERVPGARWQPIDEVWHLS